MAICPGAFCPYTLKSHYYALCHANRAVLWLNGKTMR